MAALTPDSLRTIINGLLAARERSLVRRPVHEILTSIDALAASFLDPNSSERRHAEALLSAESGLSPKMARHSLPLIFQEYRSERLHGLLAAELGTSAVLDRVENGLRAWGPRLMTHVLAGNLPGAGLDNIVFSLLVKSATLAKAASSGAGLQRLFAHILRQHDPELGACLALVSWPGGKAELENIAFSEAGLVVASGSDESLAAIRQRVSGRFIGYGHKLSLSLITHDALDQSQKSAERAAYDVVLFDQRGCLSPQVVYVEDHGAVSPKVFATLLAEALADWQTRLPRGRISPAVSTQIRRVRDEAEWQALSGKDVVLHSSPRGTEWTVIYEADPTFAPGPLYRTVRVKPLVGLEQLATLLEPWRPYLEAVGTVVPSEVRRRQTLLEVLANSGVSRICPLGTMQIPPLSWRHGGRPRLAELVRWMTSDLG